MRATSPSAPHLFAVQRRHQLVTHRRMLLSQVEQRVELRRADVQDLILIDEMTVVVDMQPSPTLQRCPGATGARREAELGCDAIRNRDVLEVGAGEVAALGR